MTEKTKKRAFSALWKLYMKKDELLNFSGVPNEENDNSWREAVNFACSEISAIEKEGASKNELLLFRNLFMEEIAFLEKEYKEKLNIAN